ncbi:MAG: hypothetical protein ACLQU4_12975 [Limisphaerales bacterium]
MIRLIKLWILGSAACVSAGWILSFLHQVNLAGYVVFFLALAVVLAVEYQVPRRASRAACAACAAAGAKGARRILRLFRRLLPLLFFLTAILALAGGAVHAPNNYDALTYRFPRMLHWWAASGWHWIATPNDRMNLAGTGFEWLMMPLFVLTHSDRLFFLINIIAYLLLPGLVFLVFVAAGVARRVAWFWMWLLPAALCYAMQAGSISNDTIAATYFLAAIYFALEARRSGNVRNLWLAFLAAGLLTGVKASNLPLLLPVAWAVWPTLGLAEKRFPSSIAVVLLSVLVSFLPTAALNQHYAGDWAGDPNNVAHLKVDKPLAGFLGNSLQLGLQSLEPPFMPVARSVEIWVWDHFPEDLQTTLKDGFPHFGVGFRELPQEESAGMGIGITVIALISLAVAVRSRPWKNVFSAPRVKRHGLVMGLLTWVALAVYMAKLGSESTSRLIAAYYPLLMLPLLLNRGQGCLIRQRWYRAFAICASLIALLAVILTPSRPLWPAERFFDWFVQRFPGNALIERARTVYSVYRCRSDLFASLRRSIPASVPVIGLIEGGNDAESSWWRPFGQRRVVHVLEGDRRQESSLHWIAVRNDLIGRGDPGDFEQWLQRDGGSVIARQIVTERVINGPETWSVVYFPGAPN